MPRQIDTIPFARNDLSSDYLFSQREYYQRSTKIFPVAPDIPKSIDFWYGRPGWGKVDTRQRYVYPKNTSLNFLTDREELLAINFVVDAYTDMANFVSNATNAFRTSMTSIIDIENPKKAYQDIIGEYNTYFNENIDVDFINNFLTKKDQNNIFSFLDYSNKFYQYCLINSTFPFTLAGYLSSVKCSSRVSGLIIEFSDEVYDNDTPKWNDFLSSDYFTDYVKIAASYGFYVNRNIPWAIVANLNSKQLKKYMAPYGISNDVQNFNLNYFQAEYISYISFKKYMFLSYKGFINFRPRIENITQKNCIKNNFLQSKYKTKRTILPRPNEFPDNNQIDYDTFLDIYPEREFLKRYLDIRLIEEKIPMTPSVKEKMYNKIFSVLKNEDLFETTVAMSNILVEARVQNKKYLTPITDNDIVPRQQTSGTGAASYFGGGSAASTPAASSGGGGGGSSTSGY